MSDRVIPYWRWVVGLAILVVFVIWAERTVGWRSIAGAWSALDPVTVAGAVALLAASYLARAWRIRHAFDGTRIGPCVRIVLVHTAANNVLPVRSGELAFPVMMGRVFRVPVSLTVPRLLWFRVLDAVVLFGTAGAILAARVLDGPVGGAVAVGWIAAWGLLLVLAYALRGPLAARLEGREGRLARVCLRLVEGVPVGAIARRRLEAWTLATWGLKLTAFTLLLQQFGGLDRGSAVLGAVGGELSSVLPIHGLAGAGTYEAGMLVVLTPLQVAVEQALPAAVTLHLFILGASILGLAPAFLPLPWWRVETETT
jgi:uncharacterized membrane protein YbhN (UPF0104 family)